jgi:hypothetical protein
MFFALFHGQTKTQNTNCSISDICPKQNKTKQSKEDEEEDDADDGGGGGGDDDDDEEEEEEEEEEKKLMMMLTRKSLNRLLFVLTRRYAGNKLGTAIISTRQCPIPIIVTFCCPSIAAASWAPPSSPRGKAQSRSS